MPQLSALLHAYRHGGAFPTYAQLADIAVRTGCVPLNRWLQEYREGAPFPSYSALASLAP